MGEYSIEVENISMVFNLAKEKTDSLKEHFIKRVKGQINYEKFYAVKDVSFKVKTGDSFALIGANGSGKSTVLKIIAGIYHSTSGTVKVTGTIAPLIELGSGFDGDLTARENIFLNGALLGYSKEEMKSYFETIMDFSELWEFVDVPIKNYSSGMTARLGFAIATIVKPDILIVDEILSVGDASFQHKCEKKMADLKADGTTMLMVSHSKTQVLKMCKHGIWLNRGMIMANGDIRDVYAAYEESIK
jgi:ABC-type polysaccharide/polyol phosphate transport system ATPase subunit